MLLFSSTVPVNTNGSFVIFHRHLRPLVDAGWKLKIISYFDPPAGETLWWEHIRLPFRRAFWPPAWPGCLSLMRLRARLLQRHLVQHGLLEGPPPRVLLANLWDPQAQVAAAFAASGAGRLGVFVHDDEILWNAGAQPERYLKWNRRVVAAAASRLWPVSDRLAAQFDPAARSRCRVMRPIPNALPFAAPEWRPEFGNGIRLGYAGKIYPGLWPLLARLVRQIPVGAGSLTVITDKEAIASAPFQEGPTFKMLPYFAKPDDSARWLQTHCSALLVAHPLAENLPNDRWQILKSSFPSKLTEYSRVGLPLVLIGQDDSEFCTWVRSHTAIPFFTSPDSPACISYLTALATPAGWSAATQQTAHLARSQFDPAKMQAEFVAEITQLAAP
ncbi:MAG TPA: hypothetical protein VFJ90_15930 [Candidatus Didemnitutus sp.]|nr:hypothetical protein [Candidatus Didemnitutus sp.]